MVYILLLLAKELGRDRVECVGAQLVVTLNDLQHVEEDSAEHS
jgi:hypothetical protein